jgi:hypothetical protein
MSEIVGVKSNEKMIKLYCNSLKFIKSEYSSNNLKVNSSFIKGMCVGYSNLCVRIFKRIDEQLKEVSDLVSFIKENIEL